MFKFFRKIRKNLLKEDSFQKYLLYAAGEILLVMIGILLALQVNNWNEQQKNKAAEQHLLKDILREFQANQQLLLQKQKNLDTAILINDTYLQKLATGTTTFEDMMTFRTGIRIGVSSSNPSFGVINSLIASGDIKLINNDVLKYLLTSWQDEMGDFSENEQFHLNYFAQQYAGYINRNLPQNFKPHKAIAFYDLPPEKVEHMYLNATKDNEYRSYIIVNQVLMENHVSSTLKNVLRICTEVIQLIEQELNLKK